MRPRDGKEMNRNKCVIFKDSLCWTCEVTCSYHIIKSNVQCTSEKPFMVAIALALGWGIHCAMDLEKGGLTPALKGRSASRVTAWRAHSCQRHVGLTPLPSPARDRDRANRRSRDSCVLVSGYGILLLPGVHSVCDPVLLPGLSSVCGPVLPGVHSVQPCPSAWSQLRARPCPSAWCPLCVRPCPSAWCPLRFRPCQPWLHVVSGRREV